MLKGNAEYIRHPPSAIGNFYREILDWKLGTAYDLTEPIEFPARSLNSHWQYDIAFPIHVGSRRRVNLNAMANYVMRSKCQCVIFQAGSSRFAGRLKDCWMSAERHVSMAVKHPHDLDLVVAVFILVLEAAMVRAQRSIFRGMWAV